MNGKAPILGWQIAESRKHNEETNRLNHDVLPFHQTRGRTQRPAIEGRFVTQWQLDKAQGVVPAQLIISFEHARRTAMVTANAFRIQAGFPKRSGSK